MAGAAPLRMITSASTYPTAIRLATIAESALRSSPDMLELLD